MAHAATWRGRDSGDEAHNRFLHLLLDELSGFLLRIAADFADHHDRVSLGIFLEQSQDIDKPCPIDWIAANADARRFT